MAIGDREQQYANREGAEQQCGCNLADHLAGRPSPPPGAECARGRRPIYSRLRRSRISLPVLKNGTLLRSTDTCAPVRGLRPVRAGRFLTETAAKPRHLTRPPRAIAATISPRIALTIFSTSR